MNAHITRLTAALTVAGLLLGGCGGSGGNGSGGIPPITSVNPLTTGKLTFSVGTANIAGTAGLNVVATYRQANGLSNTLVNSPTITGPFTLPKQGTPGLSYDPDSSLPGGPGPGDSAGTITSTPQGFTQTTVTTFGQSGGVFTNGFAPANAATTSNNGQADSYIPYGVPLYFPNPITYTPGTAVNVFEPWGGPPAFDPNKDNMGLRDGLSSFAGGVVGIPEGFTVFQGVAASAGSYTLKLTVPTGFSGQTPTTGTVSATASLASTTLLPTLTAPALTLDGSGGGSVVIPASDFTGGISEIYIQIVDYGNGGAATCQGVYGPQGSSGPVYYTGSPLSSSAGPVYYTIIAKSAGTYTLPDMDGPNTNTKGGTTGLTPSPSICTAAQNTTAAGAASPGDNYGVTLIGLDYDMYGATYPINTAQTPTVAGANGQSDITISGEVTGTSP